MSRYDLTDFEWRVIEPLLPNKPRGVPRVDDRRVLVSSGDSVVILVSARACRTWATGRPIRSALRRRVTRSSSSSPG